MKNLFTLLTALLIVQLSFAQTFIQEDFSSSNFPPNGFTIEGFPNQWSRSSTANAGGSSPEAKFTYIQTNSTSRLVSPNLDLTGYDEVTLNFRHFYDYYATGVTIGLATRIDGGEWQVAWQVSPTGNVGPALQTVEISDVGENNFQFSIFISGNLYNVDYWYIDDIKLFVRQELDASMQSLDLSAYFTGEQEIKGKVMNEGINVINSFDINWTLDEGDVNTTSFSGLNLNTNQIFNFTADQSLIADPGTHDFKIWVSNVNEDFDQNPENDTINRTVGVATQTVQRRPLFEEFTSSTCAPCASFNNSVFNPFIEQHGEEIAIVKYQMNWPGSGDPYYTAEGGVRRTYYGVNAVPMLFVEGTNVATSAGAVNNAFNNGMDNPAFVSIEAIHSIEGSEISVEAQLTPYVDLFDVTVHMVVIEKLTTENVASNGETEFHHVMMKMLPDANGTTMDIPSNETTILSYSYDMSSTNVEEMDDLMVVVFIQDNANKGIFQAAYSEESAGFPATVNFDPAPGSTGVETFADITLNLSEPVHMVGGEEITNENVADLITLEETEGDAFPFTATINEEKTQIVVSPEGLLNSYTWYTLTLAPVENEAGIATEPLSTYFETGMHVGLSENQTKGSLRISPNPVQNETTIRFSLTEKEMVSIKLYDLKGRVIATVSEREFSAGDNTIRWTPESTIPVGMYILNLQTENQNYTTKIVLNR
ncbi:MAG: T9SS type A sorting domain-containing protein [Bacteroidales bacterium]|jgi:hypothetical protein|nr:T9SS type A sorting domain-containing protein [Bacteroidales bacterium]